MKRLFKGLVLSVLTVVFMGFAEAFAFAETKTDDLITLDTDTNLTVRVDYETEEPTVSFIAPNGDEVREGSEGVEVKHDTEGKSIYFQISNAKRGDWKIVYDKKSNPQIGVSFGKFSDGIWIDSVNIGKLEGSKLEVSLEVSQTENIRYDYKIYGAVVDAEGNITGKKLLSQGNAYANEPMSTNVDLSSLGSSDYYIYAEISATDHGVYIFDEMLSENFVTYTNPDAPEAVSDLYVEVDLTNDRVVVDWKDYCSSRGDKIIGIFAQGETEPLYAFTAVEGETSITADVDLSKLPLVVEFTYKDGNRISDTFRKEIDLGDVTVEMKNNGLVNSYSALFDYKTSSETTFDVVLDEGDTYQITGNGNGNFSVKLNKNFHEIQVSYLRHDNIRAINKFEVVVDDVAPEMEFYENQTTIRTTQESFDIIGSVEAGAVLEVGTVAVETAENGGFKYNVKLNVGNNRFEFVATDRAGNKTLKRIEIIREENTAAVQNVVENTENNGGFFRKYLALIITLGVSLVVAVAAIILSLKKKVSSNKKFLYMGIMILVGGVAVLSLVGVVALLIYRYNLYKKIGPENFLKALDSSMNEAYENILRYNNNGEYLKILIVVFVVSAVISLFMALGLIISKKLRNKKPKAVKAPKKVAKAEPEKAEAPATEKTENPPKTEAPKFCRKCGTPLNGGKFCKNCGEKV